MFIIAIFLLSLSGCGYKADPYYEKSPPKSDENVQFFIKKQQSKVDEKSESCQ